MCISDYYNDPLQDNVCTECKETGLSWISITGIMFLAIVGIIYGIKYYYENVGVSLYVHDWYYSDTWFVKFKILHMQDKVRSKNKNDVRLIEASMRKANELMLKYDKKMEPVVDSMWAKIKIYASFFQLVALLRVTVGESQIFGKFQKLTAYLAIINLDFPLTFSLQCTWKYDFVDVLLAITIFPLVVCGGISTLYGFYVHLSTDTLAIRKRRENQCVVSFFVWSFLTLPAATSAIFQMLTPCKSIDTEYSWTEYKQLFDSSIPSYLHADSSISCDSDRYSFGIVWAYIMLVAYVLIIPAIYIRLVIGGSHFMKTRYNTIYALNEFKTGIQTDSEGEHVVNKHATRERLIALKPLKFLFAAYQPQYYFWEIIETYRRILLAGVIIMFQYGKTLQLVSGCVICVGGILLSSTIRPYESGTAALSSTLTQWQLFGLFFVLLVSSDERFSGTRHYGIDWAMIGIVLGGLVVELLVHLLPVPALSRKSKYMAVHTEVQMSDDKPPEKEFDEDYDLSFPGDPQPPLLLSRSNSQVRFISRENSFSSLQHTPLQRSLSHYNTREESLKHWDSSPLSRQSSSFKKSQSIVSTPQQESKEQSGGVPSTPGSRFFLRGPALEQMFHHEIQNYETITIEPNQSATMVCSGLDMPELSAGKPGKVKSIDLETNATNITQKEDNGNQDSDRENVAEVIEITPRRDLSPVDDRERKFKYVATPIKPSALSPITPSVGTVGPPSLNKARTEEARREEERRRIAAEEAALLEEKKRMLEERESLLHANDKLK